MIAADTSSLIAYFQGESGADVEAIERALSGHVLLLPPVVATELLSDPKAAPVLQNIIFSLPMLATGPGYFYRAGAIRAILLSRKYKARVADALIAQSCIDHRIPLITRDSDFKPFVKLTGLTLAV